jgi:type II secretion system protein N
MKNCTKWLFFTFYLATALAFFLYFLFPENAIREQIRIEAQKKLPGFDLMLGRVRPELLPPGAVIIPAVLLSSDIETLRFDILKISPRSLNLTGNSGSRFRFKGTAYGGAFTGSFTDSVSKKKKNASLKSSFSGIRIEDISTIKKLFSRRVSGAVNGKVSIKINNPIKADIKLDFSKVRMEFANHFIGDEVLEFSRGQASLHIVDNLIDITNCDIRGEQVDLFLRGKILGGLSAAESVLELSGYVNPHAEFLEVLKKKIPMAFFPHRGTVAGGFSFRVTGTVDRPAFFWN